MLVNNVMTSPVIGVSSETFIIEAIKLMLDHKISGFPVPDDKNKIVGVISESDFLQRREIDTLPKHLHLVRYFSEPRKTG